MVGGATRPLVLGYHAVSSTWANSLAVSVEALALQLEYLSKRGYLGLTLTDAERRRRAGSLPRKSVVVTFDDGYASTERAAPVLASFGFPGTVFLVTDFVESRELLSWPGIEDLHSSESEAELRPLSWEGVERLAGAGWEIGSHTMSHPLLTRVEDDRLRRELEGSREVIVRRLGSCSSIAYPYGLADEHVADAARRAGYDVAVMLTFAHFVDEPLRRPRVGMTSEDTRLRLAAQVSGAGQAFRRSVIARSARALRRRRTWLPEG
jgi:peptidoglycan/xylan/chitin deacetylase (PgdA/CDA1 family)